MVAVLDRVVRDAEAFAASVAHGLPEDAMRSLAAKAREPLPAPHVTWTGCSLV